MAKRTNRKTGEPGAFMDIVNTALSSFERPKPIAKGVYRGVLLPPKKGRSPAKKTPFRQFAFQPQEEIKIIGDQQKDWATRRVGMDKLYISAKAMWAVREFFEHLGLNVDQTLPQLLQEATGLEIYAFVDVEETDDGDGYNLVTDFSPEALDPAEFGIDG